MKHTVNNYNENEVELLNLLESIKAEGKRIQVQLSPDQKKYIERGAVNKCRVESSAIDGRYKYFTNISESFYDTVVVQFHS